ncbi:uncharacterized protein LOC141608209 [Silene latifolia]|uniref:uncharacterized protein LOC141608209 n=1 Tax=Silene latifolia TaxID=37657 RepID=UPI003D7761F2
MGSCFSLILHNYHIIPISSFARARFPGQISAYSIIIAMSDPTSNVTSSSCNDIHVSAIISKDSNDMVESSITSIVLIEPPNASSSTPYVEQHSVPSCVHQLLLDSTPGGSELWIRNVAAEFKPHIGQLFGTLEEAISFYDVYAEACGFEPRKSSQKRYVSGDVKYKFVVCNREGFRDRKRKATVLDSGKEQETPRPFDIRNTKLNRIGCITMIEFRYNGDGTSIFTIKTIIDHSRVNQGPIRAFRNVEEYVDGYENVGAQLVDFKNFGRDIKYFIGDRDAQLFVNYFEDKRDTTKGFYFAYEVDSGKCLVRAFWCDAESRRNYALFEHHKSLVTFASALLFHEDEDSFKWVFEKFIDAMGQRESHCIITDQCAGIKLGLRAVFKHVRRRYCMWHIMQKLTDKVGPAISKETDFVSRLNAIVWDAELEPLEFEEKCCQLVNEHNLEDFQVEASASICSLSVGGFTPPANGIEKGIICRHIIWVYSGKQVHTLPHKYIIMRWTKNAHKIPLYGPHGELIEDFDATDLRKMEMCKLWSKFYATISVLKNVSTKDITDLVDTLKQFRVKLNPQSESMTKEQELEMLLGCSSSTEVRILPPRQGKNKGSGKRMISKKQQYIAKAEKPKRLCRNCKQMSHHDKRNCPNAFVPDADNKAVQMRMMPMMVDRSKEFLLMTLINYSSSK